MYCHLIVFSRRINQTLVCASFFDITKVLVIVALVKRTFNERCMVFIQTKVQAHRMHLVLGLLGINVGEIHGNLSQMQVS